eukprot:7560924-Pyramimonas_sp.AAC.1
MSAQKARVASSCSSPFEISDGRRLFRSVVPRCVLRAPLPGAGLQRAKLGSMASCVRTFGSTRQPPLKANPQTPPTRRRPDEMFELRPA